MAWRFPFWVSPFASGAKDPTTIRTIRMLFVLERKGDRTCMGWFAVLSHLCFTLPSKMSAYG